MADFDAIANNLIAGQAPKVKALVEQAVQEGTHVGDILQQGLIKGMSVIGQRFKNNECYVPEVLIAARAMKAGMEIIRPLLAEAHVEPVGTVVIGTVKGDLHDIGKNLVAMMLEGAGFQVVDLGVDVSPQQFIDAAKQHGAQIIGMSALLTTTMTSMKTTIEAIKASGLEGQVRTIIGGAPVTQAYAEEVGADGYARDAASAADKAKELLAA
ncbi:MAG: corrinoid protein [Candidatus Latescibacteria bacterium]|nr:corrinoid protein [Candidatus Latescibacterota bacterium]